MKKVFKLLLCLCIGCTLIALAGCNHGSAPQQPKTYTITFNANNDTNETVTQTFTEGIPQTLNTFESLGFSYKGHVFLGWSILSISNTVTYSDGEEITVNNNFNLYAVWKFTGLKTGDEINEILRKFPEARYFKPASSPVSQPSYYLDDAEEIPVWYESNTKTIYYYSTTNELILNPHSGYMFKDLRNLIEIDTTSFDTSNVTYMFRMFDGCESLNTLDVSNFDTSKVGNMGYMFNGCKLLTTLDVSNFDTSRVTFMAAMFERCEALTTLDVSNFNTSRVFSMGSMFERCEALTTLDVSNFNTSNVNLISGMFECCRALTAIYASEGTDWNKSKDCSSTGMFNGCSKLKGGNNTAYNEAHTDITYAKIDEGPSSPGYFTVKQ